MIFSITKYFQGKKAETAKGVRVDLKQ